MPPLLRSILAVVAGILVGGVVNMGLVWLNVLLFPLPPGVDMKDSAALGEMLAQAPVPVLLLVLLAHSGHSLVGAWVAAKLAGRAPMVHGLIVGVLVLLAGIANVMQLRPPVWFAVVDLALYLPAAWLGAKLAGTGQRAGAPVA